MPRQDRVTPLGHVVAVPLPFLLAYGRLKRVEEFPPGIFSEGGNDVGTVFTRSRMDGSPCPKNPLGAQLISPQTLSLGRLTR